MSDVGVLFVHGIQGSPSQFDFLISRLPDSVTVCNVLLPGHGTTIREFRNSSSSQWLPAVRDAAQKMKSQCERLYFVGHSMGGNSVVNAAARMGGVKGLPSSHPATSVSCPSR